MLSWTDSSHFSLAFLVAIRGRATSLSTLGLHLGESIGIFNNFSAEPDISRERMDQLVVCHLLGGGGRDHRVVKCNILEDERWVRC